MGQRLLPIERQLLNSINFKERTNYKAKNLMEWSTNKEKVEGNLREGEKLYEVDGFWVAIKP